MIGGIVAVSIAQSVGGSALSFQSQNRVDFTFRPTVTVTLSPVGGGPSSDLLIDNLPTNSSDVSNAINVGVATNTLGGLVLNATVGNESIAAANVTNLNHTGTTSNSKFASIATDANLASLTTDNTWGYATSTNFGSSWSNYNGLPAYNTETPATLLDITPNPYGEPSSGSIQFRIGAKAGGSQTSGSYTNTINFTAVTKPMVTFYNIVYHDNSGAGADIPSGQSGSINTDDATVALSSSEPTRSGYEFTGWCTVSTNDDTCSGAIYQAGESYPIANVGGAVPINLYAMWALPTTFDDAFVAVGKTKLGNYYQMQDMSSSVCSAVTTGQESQLIDNRDGKVYYVAKLADDNCWMTQNLDFDIVNGGRDINYTNTDVPEDWEDAGDLTDTQITGDSSWGEYADVPESYDPGDICWDGKLESETTEDCSRNGNHYHLGNYYNWTAAVAMSDSSGYANDGDDANQSICPAGWRLPLGGSETGSKSFYDLVSQYDSYTMWGAPLYFPLSGAWSGDLIGVGVAGACWSSVVYESDLAYFLYFTFDGDVNPDDIDSRNDGLSVRCVAR